MTFKTKRNVLTIILFMALICCFILVGCGKKDSSVFEKTEGVAQKVYVIKATQMSQAEREMITSLQGILAQYKATVFIEDLDGGNENKNTKLWLDDLQERYSVTVEYVNNAWRLLTMFKGYIKDAKYVLYTSPESSGNMYDQSINFAATVSGVENFVMVDKSIELLAKSRGFSLGKDVTNTTPREIFSEYENELNNNLLIHQNPIRSELRDYGIANKAFCYYSDFDTDSSLYVEVLDWLKDNAPIFGWTENEVSFVSANAMSGKIVIPSDWSSNLSFYSAIDKDDEVIEQLYEQQKITANKDKHYVSIVMSDGDNIQWLQRNFINSNSFFGSQYRGDFKMTWGISPSFYDLAPNIMEKIYSQQTQNDQFITGPGGLGYVNISEYHDELLSSYASSTAEYMKKTDLQYVNFIDTIINENALDAFSEHEQIRGGIWSIGDKYIEGGGSVYWSNGKPFITARETLWRVNGGSDNEYYGYPERVAQRINSYKCDPSVIEGYTVVVAHAWSIGTMDDIYRFVNSLDEHVEIVTVGELVEMVKENVLHENVYELQDKNVHYFDGNLVPISSEQLVWNNIKDKKPTSVREFNFNNIADLGGFEKGAGSRESDKAVWIGEKNNSIMLDGSDMGDTLDVLPNSWIYNCFELGSHDDLLTINVYSGDKADTHFRIKVLYEDDFGNLVVDFLNDGFGGASFVNSNGYYLLTEKSNNQLTFDISKYKNKKVIISFEQDDNGEGSGEIVYIDYIKITATENYGE